MPTNGRKLTGKQRAFAHAYVGDAKRNATEAARMAGYKGTERTLNVTGSRLLRNDKVAAYIAELESDFVKRQDIAGEEVYETLAAALRFDIAECTYRDEEGVLRLHDIDRLPRHVRIALGPTGFVMDENDPSRILTARFRPVDRLKAADQLAKTKALDLYASSKHEHHATDDFTAALAALVGKVHDEQEERAHESFVRH